MTPPFSSYILQLSPNVVVCIATAGLCLIFLELNRPGRIVPGALGLLLLLLAAGVLAHHALRPWAVCGVLLNGGVVLLNWWRRLPAIALCVNAFALAVAVRFLCQTSEPVHIAAGVAVACGGGLGVLGGMLTRVARYARRLKAVD